MSDSFIGVFSMGAMAGMFIAVVIELLTVVFMERIEEPDEEPKEEPKESKDAELLKRAKKLNVKVGE